MEAKSYENIEHALCKELEEMETKFKSGQKMTPQDLECVDKIYHALKSMATYKAMKEAEEYENDMMEGKSGMRGRDASTGRYMSRATNPTHSYRQSYAQGYSEGYQDGQERNMSGHYPMGYYPNYEPRW